MSTDPDEIFTPPRPVEEFSIRWDGAPKMGGGTRKAEQP